MMGMQKRGRRDKLLKQKRHDTYLGRGKWPEPTICSVCSCLYQGGRWSWNEPPEGANQVVCPACQRITDRYPAGNIEIKGEFFYANRREILNLIYNEEGLEKGERPMERIMEVVDEGDRTIIYTTGVHMARRIGESLSRAYQGNFSFQYGDAEKSIRVYWDR